MIKQCPNCKKLLKKNYARSDSEFEVYDCPKSKGGCGYSNIKSLDGQFVLPAFVSRAT